MLLEKMDTRRLKENPESKDDFCAHECKHCRYFLESLWKVKGTVKKEGVGGSWHAMHACRHLEKVCNEEGHVFIHFVQCYELKQLCLLTTVFPIPWVSSLPGETQLNISY